MVSRVQFKHCIPIAVITISSSCLHTDFLLIVHRVTLIKSRIIELHTTVAQMEWHHRCVAKWNIVPRPSQVFQSFTWKHWKIWEGLGTRLVWTSTVKWYFSVQVLFMQIMRVKHWLHNLYHINFIVPYITVHETLECKLFKFLERPVLVDSHN